MAKEIRVSASSRLVRASDLRLFGPKRGKAIDFARDHLVIVDAENRIVGEYRPVERVGVASPVLVAHSTPGPARGTPPATEAMHRGRLSRVQEATLIQFWLDNPHAGPDVIAQKFLDQTGRAVGIETATNYRPKAGAAG